MPSSQLGDFIDASPGNVGKVRMKCEIYANKPIFRRKLQDINLILSPETLAVIPDEIRRKLFSVPGNDGVFLEPRYIEASNFVAVLKENDEREEEVGEFFTDQLVEDRNQSDGGDGDEGDSPDYTQLTADEIDIIPPYGVNNPEVIEDILPLSSDDPAVPHYTWILDGSLWVDQNLSLLDHFRPPEADDATQFLPQFQYGTFETGYIDPTDAQQSVFFQNYIRYFPLQERANGSKSPKDVPSIVDQFPDNVFYNVNPGIHSRLQKRTPVFQGADFWVEFKKGSPLEDLPDHGNSQFPMRDKYKTLDVRTNSSLASDGSGFGPIQSNEFPYYVNEGVLQFNQDGSVDDEAKAAYDLTRQPYYMIEIGVEDPNHNYFILITKNTFPILLHVGEAVTTIPIEFEENDRGERVVTKRGAVLPNEPISRRISVYKQAPGRTLMAQDNLRVTVRNHFGNLVVTFSGFENDPWIISRSDIQVPVAEVASSVVRDETAFAEEFRRVSVPMIVPNAPVAIYSGNIRSGFSFNYLKYEKTAAFPHPQAINLRGPIETEDISIYLRDKGYSYNPEIAASNYYSTTFFQEGAASRKPDQFPSNGINFSQDAQRFIEFLEGEQEIISAADVQQEKTQLFGKAPDMENRAGSEFLDQPILPSSLKVIGDTTLTEIGSSGNNAVQFTFVIQLESGDYLFEQIDGTQFILKSVITPIMTGCRIYVPPEGTAYDATPIDVAHHVMNFTENWSAKDFTSIEHTGNITFLINENMVFQDGNNQADFIANLVDKTFYLQVSLWWEGGIMPLPESDIDRIVFTGMCRGGTIEVSNNKRIMKCEIVDYMQILRDQIMLNSPFFDKMRDFNAVYEVLRMAGFRDDDSLQPASLMKRLAFYDGDGGWAEVVHNSETIEFNDFALPGSYDIIQNPFLRFQDGTAYVDIIDKIAKLTGKMAYFDRLGVFHLDNLPDERIFFQADDLDDETNVQDPLELSILDVYASPLDKNDTNVSEDIAGGANDSINNSDNTSNNNPDPVGEGGDGSSNIACPGELHRQAFNMYTYKRVVEDVVNEIKIISTTPNGEVLVAGHVNYPSLFDHTSPGFLGYSKVFFQMDGIFGSEDAVKKVVKHYTKMFTPPITLSFEIFGHNKLKALDIISFQFLGRRAKQPLRINSITSEVDPSKNSWMQKLECEWIFPSQAINWGPSANENS